MKTVSLIGSVSRLAGGLFESVRRLHQELVRTRNADMAGTQREPMRVTVLGTRDEFTGDDISAWRPVEVTALEVRGPRAFGYSPGLTERLMILAPDLVHVHGLWQHSSVVALAWHNRSAKPYMVSPHGMLDPWAMTHSRWKKRLCWRAYEKSHLESAACIRALCEGEATVIRQAGLTNPVCVIPNGIDLPELSQTCDRREADERRLDWKREGDPASEELDDRLAGRKVLLYLGRIHPKKGLSNLVEAWVKVRPPAEWLLVIAGWDQGGHEAELRTLAGEQCADWSTTGNEVGQGGSIVFVGPQYGTSKQGWLRRCDAFILPSYSEGLPMAVLEAWSFGKPVLATSACNLPEGFATGAAIRIGGTVDKVASGLRILLSAEKSALSEVGKRGRALVARRFAWDKVGCDLKSVYRWMLNEGPKPGCVK